MPLKFLPSGKGVKGKGSSILYNNQSCGKVSGLTIDISHVFGKGS